MHDKDDDMTVKNKRWLHYLSSLHKHFHMMLVCYIFKKCERITNTLLISTLHALTILEIINQHASEAVKQSTLGNGVID